MLFATTSAFAFSSVESTCPDKVTTPFVELTETFVTQETPVSVASFEFDLRRNLQIVHPALGRFI